MGIFDDIFPELAQDLLELFAGDTMVTITVEAGAFDFREDETLSEPLSYQVLGSPPINYTDRELSKTNNVVKGDARIYVSALDVEAVGLLTVPDPEKHKLVDGLGTHWNIVKSTLYPSGDLQTIYEIQVRK